MNFVDEESKGSVNDIFVNIKDVCIAWEHILVDCRVEISLDVRYSLHSGSACWSVA